MMRRRKSGGAGEYKAVPMVEVHATDTRPAPPPPPLPEGPFRCTRCERYFSGREEGSSTCRYHGGEFGPGMLSNRYPSLSYSWSCCGSAEKEATGCTLSDTHVVCEVTRRALAEFRGSAGNMSREGCEGDALAIPSADAGEVVLDLRKAPKPVAETETQTEDQPEADGAFLKHTYRLGETLPGLALRYGVTVGEIQAANGFSGSFAGSSLDPGAARQPCRPPTLAMSGPGALGNVRHGVACAEPAGSAALTDRRRVAP